MSYLGDAGEVSALWRPTDTVERLDFRSGTTARFVAPGGVTDGRFGLFEWNMPANGGGADPHFHKTFSESFYVFAGSVRLYDGDRWVVARAGDYLHVPEGGIHAFANPFDEPASMLILFAPAPPREKYFRALAEIAASGRTMTDDERAAFLAEHDQYSVPLRES
jgi:mannose-6-phosphate isomerase-like protein (cupin superfamily)